MFEGHTNLRLFWAWRAVGRRGPLGQAMRQLSHRQLHDLGMTVLVSVVNDP
jgi:hypothetical protein